MIAHTRKRLRPTLRGLGFLVAAAAASTALAAAAQPEAVRRGPSLDEYLARSITRAALMDLRFTADPRPEDYRIASILMGLAHDLLPKDQEILRRQIEAATGAGDSEAVLASTRALLRLDGTDTVAQLRLITASILQNTQNADDRLAMYEAYLTGPSSGSFDPSIRSRLALDAALLLRDAGDIKGFLQKLTLATQLDATHKEAHALAAAFFAEQRPDDAVGRLQLLEHLLMADPMDPNVHLSIARELAGGRAFIAAQRFHKNATVILGVSGGPIERAAAESLVLRWHVDGPGAVAAQLNKDLAVGRDGLAREIRRVEALGQPTDSLKKPEDLRLTVPIQSLYAMAVQATGDAAATAAAMSETVNQFAGMMTTVDKAVNLGKMGAEEANKIRLDLALQIQTLRLWTNVQAEEAKKDIEANPILREAYPDAVAVLDGWVQIRTGDPRAGIQMLSRFGPQNMLALLGTAVAHEALGETQEAVALYDRVVRLDSMELTGAWARSRLLALGFKEDKTVADQLEKVVKGIPDSIGATMVEQPRRFVELTVSLTDNNPEGLDRTPLRIKLRNLSQFPMSLGADRALNSRMLISPRMDNFQLGQLPLMRPEVVDLDRRLRLMPFETIEAEVWPDSGQSGWLMEALANRSVRVRWRIVQGFVLDSQGVVRPGPMCLSTETDAVIRSPLPEAQLTPDELAKRVAGDPTDVMLRLAASARSLVLQPLMVPALGGVPAVAPQPPGAAPADPAGDQALKPVADAFAARYSTLTPTTRAMLAVILPHERLCPPMAVFDKAVAADADPVVLCVALALRVADPADPIMTKARESDDPRVKELAELVTQRLARNEKTYARFDVATLAAPKPDQRPGAPAPGGGR